MSALPSEESRACERYLEREGNCRSVRAECVRERRRVCVCLCERKSWSEGDSECARRGCEGDAVCERDPGREHDSHEWARETEREGVVRGRECERDRGQSGPRVWPWEHERERLNGSHSVKEPVLRGRDSN